MRPCLLITACLVCTLFAGRALSESGAIYGYDLDGKPVERLAARGTQAVVLLFIATDCPVSNRYVPEIQRLEKEFAARHVVFWMVYPNATESVDGIRRHQADYGIAGPTLLRPSPRLLTMTHPTITPEAAVLVEQGEGGQEAPQVVYVGRVDDRYIEIGRQRPQATRHDLENAVTAALDHRPVQPPGGPPVGCGIISESVLRSGAGKP